MTLSRLAPRTTSLPLFSTFWGYHGLYVCKRLPSPGLGVLRGKHLISSSLRLLGSFVSRRKFPEVSGHGGGPLRLRHPGVPAPRGPEAPVGGGFSLRPTGPQTVRWLVALLCLARRGAFLWPSFSVFLFPLVFPFVVFSFLCVFVFVVVFAFLFWGHSIVAPFQACNCQRTPRVMFPCFSSWAVVGYLPPWFLRVANGFCWGIYWSLSWLQ